MKVAYVFFGHVVWAEAPDQVPKELKKDTPVIRAFGRDYPRADYTPPWLREAETREAE